MSMLTFHSSSATFTLVSARDERSELKTTEKSSSKSVHDVTEIIGDDTSRTIGIAV